MSEKGLTTISLKKKTDLKNAARTGTANGTVYRQPESESSGAGRSD